MPAIGERVKIWPYPGLRVQHGATPVDAKGGGRFLHSTDATEVIWSVVYQEQFNGGQLLLHAPPDEEAIAAAKEPKSKVKE